MALSKREMSILWLTIGLICIYILWMFGIQPLWADYLDTSTLLAKERTTYQDNKKILKRGTDIDRQYKEIEAQFPKQQEGKRADHAFSEDVISQVEAVMGSRPKDVQPVTREEMKDVRGYDYMTFTLRVIGELDKVSSLLKSFEQKGFLIQNLTMTHPQLDNPQLQVDITLARIVKQEEEAKKPRRRPGMSLARDRS